jgi:hypothetical protein
MAEELGLSDDRQRTVDNGHLNTLSVFHFIGAGLALLGMVFVGMHFAVMGTMMKTAAVQQGQAPPAEFFDLFRWVYVFMGGWYVTSLVLNILGGIYLRARKHRTFCLVVAAVNCLHIPLGTILGIFTIVVLARNSVRDAFVTPTYGGRLE